MTDLSLRYILLGEDKSATSTIGKVGGAFSKMGSTVGGEFGDLMDKIGSTFDSMAGKQASFGQKIMGAGGAAAGIGTAMSLIGSADKQASDQLEAAVTASGHSFDDYKGAIDDAVKKQEDFGHSAVDTQGALAKMTQATGDPKKALGEMALVADLAASKHISLTDAADKVDKILGGKGSRTLAEYGITMGKSKDKTKDTQDALEKLAKKVDGQASASVDNFGSKVDIIKTKLGDWTAQMGEKFGPALQVAGIGLMALGTIIETGIVPKIAGAIASTTVWTAKMIANTAATVASNVVAGVTRTALMAWTAAQWLLNAALTANPIGLIVVAIAAFIAIVVLAWNHSETFRRVVTAAWTGIKAAVGAVVGWFTDTAWPAIQRFGGFIGDMFGKIPGLLKTVGLGILSAIVWPYRTAFNLIADLWNGTVGRMSFTVPSWVPVIGGKGFSMPQLPHMAAGGVVTRATALVAGEAGPEAIIPLSRAGSYLNGGNSGQPIVVQLVTPLGRVIHEQLVDYRRERGTALGLG